jgi:eukaryotic-like serine/threonine-protein kinase
MECVEGSTLADELRERGPLEPEEVVDLAFQICGGLEHAHAAALVHRDIKPQNLLLRADGTVKIADFGIARAAETTRLTQMGSVLGTAAYLAPEQALGKEVTASADIYSAGCVLYELLAGRTPHVFKTLPELIVKHREEAITPLREVRPEVTEPLEAAVMHALARNPEYRPESAAVFAEELAAASPGPPTRPLPQATETEATQVLGSTTQRTELLAPSAPAASPARRARGMRWDRRLILALAAVVAAVAIILGIALGTNGGESSGGEPSSGSPAVEPVPPASDPATQARNLAHWLRSNSR